MPGLDGIELAAELLKINPTLPVVLTSAAIFRMPSEKLRSLGIRDFLSKPEVVFLGVCPESCRVTVALDADAGDQSRLGERIHRPRGIRRNVNLE